jgi:hypothetical protein
MPARAGQEEKEKEEVAFCAAMNELSSPLFSSPLRGGGTVAAADSYSRNVGVVIMTSAHHRRHAAFNRQPSCRPSRLAHITHQATQCAGEGSGARARLQRTGFWLGRAMPRCAAPYCRPGAPCAVGQGGRLSSAQLSSAQLSSAQLSSGSQLS